MIYRTVKVRPKENKITQRREDISQAIAHLLMHRPIITDDLPEDKRQKVVSFPLLFADIIELYEAVRLYRVLLTHTLERSA